MTRWSLRWLLMVAVAAVGVMMAAPGARAQENDPLPTMAFVATAFDFADALAAGPIAGTVGAPIVLTPPDDLDDGAQQALDAAEADVVVLVGGTSALSPTVEAAIADQGYTVERVAGATRTHTAAALVAFADELGAGRPVVTGREVPAGTIPGLDAQTLQGQTPEDLLASNAMLQARVDELETLLAGISRADDAFGHDTLQLSGMNVQVVNGTDATDDVPNGLGNLFVGYNAHRGAFHGGTDAADRAGSHALVVGDGHHWTGFGHLLVGHDNTATGDWASVTGGRLNTASGSAAAVTGGSFNTASGNDTSVSGGSTNTASGGSAWVSGGTQNLASGAQAAVAGGRNNTASGLRTSVSGGVFNTASGEEASSVSGGIFNTASGLRASILGGYDNAVTTTDGCHPSC